MMNIDTVDMTRYRRTGAGANGESYDSLDDPQLMLKLYNSSYPVQPVIDELDIARKVFDVGVPSPEPGELVKVGDRYGIKFRKVEGKRSYSRAIADEPQRMEEYAREFARACLRLHSTHCPAGVFPTVKDQYLRLLDADSLLSVPEKEKMRRFIMSMPDTDTALHGDLHMGNILTTLPKGAPIDTPHEVLFIDLGYFATGCPLMDLGMTMMVCIYADEEFVTREMHVSREVTRNFWRTFVDEYFKGKKLEDVEKLLLPYVATKMLLVEYNIGTMPESYVPVVKAALELL